MTVSRTQWNGLDFDKIKEHSNELETFDDYLPLIFHNHISMVKRKEYLRENDLFEKINDINTKKSIDFRESKDKHEWVINDVIEWINEYPIYRELVKINYG